MKRFLNILLLIILLAINLNTNAQPLPPPPTEPNGQGNGYVGEQQGAPIGNGTLILISLAMLYGAWRIYNLRKVQPED